MIPAISLVVLSGLALFADKKIKNNNVNNSNSNDNDNDNDKNTNDDKEIEIIRKIISNNINKDSNNNLEELNKTNSTNNEHKNEIKYDIKNAKIKNNSFELLKIKKIIDEDKKEDDEKDSTKKPVDEDKTLENFYSKLMKQYSVTELPERKIIIIDDSGNKIYEGKHRNKKPHGIGEVFEGDKVVYRGEFYQGMAQGEGTLYNSNGTKIFEGSFSNNKKNGQGTEFYYNGRPKFKGNYSNNVREGKGTEYYNSDDNDVIRTVAVWKKGNIDYNEKVEEFYKNQQKKFDGYKHFYNKKGKNKECKAYHANGNLEFVGLANMGKYWNGVWYSDDGTRQINIENGDYDKDRNINNIHIENNINAISNEV